MDINKLTAKQERFCDEYIIDLNATQAAIRAGYSEKTAHSIGNENLTKPEIQNRIKEKQQEIQERNKIKADDVVQELAKIGFMTIDEIFDGNNHIKEVDMLSDKAKASISSIKITQKTYGKDDNETTEVTKEVKLWDKGKALVELGKHLGIFKEDNEQKNNKEPAQIIFNVEGNRTSKE